MECQKCGLPMRYDPIRGVWYCLDNKCGCTVNPTLQQPDWSKVFTDDPNRDYQIGRK